MKKVIILSFFLLIAGVQLSYAQLHEVSGKVTDASDGSPLPGVSVIVKGSRSGTATNAQGIYTLKVPQNTELIFSFVGMKTQTITVGSQTTIHVKLQPESEKMDEVIVIAYGTSRKESFTGSAASIGQQKLASRPLSNAMNALEGATAGVQMTSSSGQPGSAPSIRIRGIGSYKASNEPLYIVDGAPYSDDISGINPNDIESISILKDAPSTALYGSRAANGVVMITTKKGNQEQLSFQVKINQGFNSRSIPEYDKIGPGEYFELMWEAYRNQLRFRKKNPLSDEESAQKASKEIASQLGVNPFTVAGDQIVGTDGKLNPQAKLAYPDDLDWNDAIARLGYRGDYTISASGGSKKADFYFSLGYTQDNGYAIRSSLERITARARINVQPRKYFKTGVNIAGAVSQTNTLGSGEGNPFNFARAMAPIHSIHEHDENGKLKVDDAGKPLYQFTRIGNMNGRNVLAEMEYDKYKNSKNQLNTRGYIDILPLKDLKLTANFSYDYSMRNGDVYRNPLAGPYAPEGHSSKSASKTETVNYNQLLSYNKISNGHSFDLLLGHESYSMLSKYLYAERSGIVAPGNDEFVNYTTTDDLTSQTDKYRTEGYFARFNYNYKEKYYLSASWRRDGSSRFHQDSRWGDFWSVGASWRINQENFMQKIRWIDQLKLRASYGQVGNDNINTYYGWQSLYAINNNATEPGFSKNPFANNPHLEWESNNSTDVALEFSFFERLRGSIEFFHRISDNLLFEVPQPLSSGITKEWQNVGTMYNRGIEIQLNADLIKTESFIWNMDFNLTRFKNKITKLPQEEIVAGSHKLMKGKSIYEFYLLDFIKVNPDDGQTLYATNKNDEKGEPIYTTNRKEGAKNYCGTALPDFYGAMGHSFTWKGLELNFMFTYQVGGKAYDYPYVKLMQPSRLGWALHPDIKKRWQKPGDITDVPRMEIGNSDLGTASDRFLLSTSFLALKSVGLSYNVPKHIARTLDLSNIRIYISGENLFLLSKRKGFTPQQSFDGSQEAAIYSPSRLITIGLNIAF